MQSSKILLKDGQTVDLVDGRIADGDIASWNSKMDNQSVGNVSEPVYLENGIAKVATNVATNGKLNSKLNVDGSNATKDGVTAMMKKVATGSDELNDDSTYFGDSNIDHTHIVRRPILNLWNYIKNKVKTQLLGSVGSADKPIYLENGIPKIATGVSTKTDLNNLTDAVNNHTTEIGQIEEDVVGIKSSLTNKKDKQSANTFNGSSTKTVKTITQDVNGELNVEFENIDYPDYKISSSDVSINVSTSEGVTDLTLPNDVVRDSNYVHIDGATEVPLIDGNASAGVSTKYAREDHIHPTDTSREAIANKTTVILGTSDIKYPTDKAVAEFVNSSIATNTANYISNNGVPFTSVEQLNAYTGTVTNNDYAFVTGTDSEGNTYYDRYKATVKGSGVTWSLEYRLNNSSFTAAQWAAINSGITSDKANYWDGKQDALTFDGATTNQMLSKKGEWSDTIAKARAVVNYGATSKAIEIGWGGKSVQNPTYFAVYTDSANGYNKAIKDCSLENARKAINGTSVGSTAVPVFINANGAPQVCTDDFVHDGDVTSTYSSTGTAPVNGTAVASALGSKLNVDGSNATTEGVTAMMKKVSSGTDSLNDESTYFGDSNADHTHIVRRPILNLWNYFAYKVDDKIVDKLGSVGSDETPIYMENGVPKVCTLKGVPYTFVNYGKEVGYGVFVGGNTKLANTTRCSCTFLVSISSNPDLMLHTYIGTFSFRGDLSNKVMKKELKCLTGAPQYPLRIAVAYNEDGKDSNGKPTYSVGLWVIPARKTDKYSNYRLTRIASSGFIWDVKKISEVDYDNCNSGAKSATTLIDSSDGVFNSISKSESKTNGCTLKFGATDGSSKSITVKNAVEADKVDGYHISVGTTVGTDPNTIYIVNAS